MLTAMDEIIIDQKKYVSSKRAAELTGYAKDYVGQLCREGRVPARLVGRSWYVLESAIQDHRFGTGRDSSPEVKEEPQKKHEEASVLPPTWESPHYEAVHEDSLPQINRLRVTSTQTIEAISGESDQDAVARMRESWKQWFATTPNDTVSETVEEQPEEVAPTKEENALPPEPEEITVPEVEQPVSVAIHAIHHPELARDAVRDLPAEQVVDDRRYAQAPMAEAEHRKPRTFRAIKALIYFIVFCTLIVGVAGSGFMDKIIISKEQVGFLAGISVYNK